MDLVLAGLLQSPTADFARCIGAARAGDGGWAIWLHPEMIHAKQLWSMMELAMVGSANLDGRSLFINYEMMVAFYDRSGGRWPSMG